MRLITKEDFEQTLECLLWKAVCSISALDRLAWFCPILFFIVRIGLNPIMCA